MSFMPKVFASKSSQEEKYELNNLELSPCRLRVYDSLSEFAPSILDKVVGEGEGEGEARREKRDRDSPLPARLNGQFVGVCVCVCVSVCV